MATHSPAEMCRRPRRAFAYVSADGSACEVGNWSVNSEQRWGGHRLARTERSQHSLGPRRFIKHHGSPYTTPSIPVVSERVSSSQHSVTVVTARALVFRRTRLFLKGLFLQGLVLAGSRGCSRGPCCQARRCLASELVDTFAVEGSSVLCQELLLRDGVRPRHLGAILLFAGCQSWEYRSPLTARPLTCFSRPVTVKESTERRV